MTTTDIAVTVAFTTLTLSLWLGVYFCIYRNSKVYRFRGEICDLCYEYNRRHILNGSWVSAYEWFYAKHTYNEMVFSSKPLRLECWYTEEELNKIKS